MEGQRFAVIGGGLSGLTAAYYLHRANPAAELVVFEAADQLGGVIQTERRDGWLIEHGADCFSVQPADALQLCKDLGVEERLIVPLEKGRRAMVSRGSRLHPVPEGFVLMRPTRLGQVLKSPLLSISAKLRMAAEPFIKQRQETTDESLASFVSRRLGRETLERLVEPLVAGIYTADARLLSMQATMQQFVKMEREHGSLLKAARKEQRDKQSLERQSSGARYGQFRVLPGGMGELFQVIVDSLPNNVFRFGCQVQTCRPGNDGGWEVITSDGQSEHFDGVIVALPGPAAAKFLAQPFPKVSQSLIMIPYASSAIVLLGVADQQVAKMPEAFGFVVPGIDRRRILAASFASHKFPDRAPEGHTLIRVFIGGARQPELLHQTDEELTQIAIEEMRDFIGLAGNPVFTAVQRWNQAMPQYHVGHQQLVAAIEDEIAQQPGLEIAGNALHGVGIAPVVGTARRAVERMLASLQRGQNV